MEKRGRVATRNVRQCGATLGEKNCLTKKHEFIGEPFGHETGTVYLSQQNDKEAQGDIAIGKTHGGGIGMPDFTHCACWWCARRRPARALFFSEASAPEALKTQQGTLAAQTTASPASQRMKVEKANRLLSTLLGSKPVAPRRRRLTSVALATDVSMSG
ncbi:hypothetical protein ERJ75_000334300 [Trypanosoma vivax]|nr:hypothetical protein ERJ75_000334300 [Trypanosoma vivax]